MAKGVESELINPHRLDPKTRGNLNKIKGLIIARTIGNEATNSYSDVESWPSRQVSLKRNNEVRMNSVSISDKDTDAVGMYDRSRQIQKVENGTEITGGTHQLLVFHDTLEIYNALSIVIKGRESMETFATEKTIGSFVAGVLFRVEQELIRLS